MLVEKPGEESCEHQEGDPTREELEVVSHQNISWILEQANVLIILLLFQEMLQYILTLSFYPFENLRNLRMNIVDEVIDFLLVQRCLLQTVDISLLPHLVLEILLKYPVTGVLEQEIA